MSHFSHPVQAGTGQSEDPLAPDIGRWVAVVNRDPSADSRFVYAVKTTGIFCRPSCSARRPNRSNVEFFLDASAAAARGYRPCKRCRPTEPAEDRHGKLIADLCRHIATSREIPRLESLARRAKMSRFHLHRLFRATTGLTPREYALAHRARRLKRELIESPSITRAFYQAGFGSSGRFYEATNEVLGMEPKRFKNGGAGLALEVAIVPCALGLVLVAKSDRGICAVSLGDDPDALGRELRDQFPNARIIEGQESFRKSLDAVVRLIDSPGIRPTLPVDIRGTAFQQRVWKALLAIPPGSTTTYTEIAQGLGIPRSARAVAAACAANRLAVLIPCHRVVRRDGELAGYRWGLDRKRSLLTLESRTGTTRSNPEG